MSTSAEPGVGQAASWTPHELKAFVIGALFFEDDWDSIVQLVPGKQVRVRCGSS
jgi:hypothetical protein